MSLTVEHERVRTSVGLLDASGRGKLRLEGAEAGEFLQGQVTNDVEALEPGRGCYAALLTHKGKLRADMRVLRGRDWIRVDTEPLGLASVLHTVRVYSLGRDVRSVDETKTTAILSLLGPAADDALETAPPAEEHAWVEGRHGLYVRTLHGVDVVCPAEDADAVRVALGVELASPEAAECLRIEAGRPRLGVDLDADTIPQEAGLNERAVSFTKGCYVGQETVARLFYKGRPNRHLRGLRLDAPAATGATVHLGDRVVGRLGSVCVSPVLGPIALCLLRREAAPGAHVSIDGDGGAEVVELPFSSS
jgi:folate-binding protein YgfZ